MGVAPPTSARARPLLAPPGSALASGGREGRAGTARAQPAPGHLPALCARALRRGRWRRGAGGAGARGKRARAAQARSERPGVRGEEEAAAPAANGEGQRHVPARHRRRYRRRPPPARQGLGSGSRRRSARAAPAAPPLPSAAAGPGPPPGAGPRPGPAAPPALPPGPDPRDPPPGAAGAGGSGHHGGRAARGRHRRQGPPPAAAGTPGTPPGHPRDPPGPPEQPPLHGGAPGQHARETEARAPQFLPEDPGLFPVRPRRGVPVPPPAPAHAGPRHVLPGGGAVPGAGLGLLCQPQAGGAGADAAPRGLERASALAPDRAAAAPAAAALVPQGQTHPAQVLRRSLHLLPQLAGAHPLPPRGQADAGPHGRPRAQEAAGGRGAGRHLGPALNAPGGHLSAPPPPRGVPFVTSPRPQRPSPPLKLTKLMYRINEER